MNVVVPQAFIFGSPHSREEGVAWLRDIEKITRLSHRSEDRITDDSWERLLKAVVLEHGDLSVIEHRFVTVYVTCDRGISHEWVRHRVPWQYTQESTRFCNYGKKSGRIDIVMPPGLGGNGSWAWEAWMLSAQAAEDSYLKMLDSGCPPQVARAVLPTCLATRFYATSNLRGWRHFFLMRTSAEAHPQMRQITDPLLEQFRERIPLLFDDITPGERQVQAMRRLR